MAETATPGPQTKSSLTLLLDAMRQAGQDAGIPPGTLEPHLENFAAAMKEPQNAAFLRDRDDLFSGTPESTKRLNQIAQSVLSGAGGAFAATAPAAVQLQQEKREEEKKRALDRAIQDIVLENSIKALEDRIRELDKAIEKTRRDIAVKEAEIEKSKIELTGITTQITDINDKIGFLERRNRAISEQYLPQAREAIKENREKWDQILDASPLSQEAKDAYREQKLINEKLVTIGIALPGDDPALKPPVNRIVYKDEKGGYYAEDASGARHYITGDAKISWIEKQAKKGEKFGDHNDPEVENLARQYDENYKTFMKGLKELRPEMQDMLLKARADIIGSLIKCRELKVEHEENEKKIEEYKENLERLEQKKREIEEQILTQQDDLEKLHKELKKLEQEKKDAQEELTQLKNKQQHTISELNSLIRKTSDTSKKTDSILDFVQNNAVYKKFLAGEASYEEMTGAAPKELRDALNTKEVKEQLKQAQEEIKTTGEAAKITTETASEFEKIMAGAPVDRHAQLRDKYDADMNSFEKWMVRRPNVTVNELSAEIYASLFSDTLIAKAWKDPIKTSGGEEVYRENTKDGKFYTLNEDGTRREIEDAAELRRIALAYANGKLVANETPYGKDETNTFADTRAAQLKTSEAIEAEKGKAVEAKQEHEEAKLQPVKIVEAAIQKHTNPTPANPSMPAARHENAGKMSSLFANASTLRVELDKLPLPQLENTVRNDHVLTRALKAAGVDIEEMLKNPAQVKTMADGLEQKMKTEGADFGKQIAELRELQERLSGQQIDTPRAAQTATNGASS